MTQNKDTEIADLQIEATLVIHTSDGRLREELEKILPFAEISEADNFVGGTQIAAFFKYSLEALKQILEFVNKHRDRIKSSKVTIGEKQINLEGYSADDVERLLNSPGFLAALQEVHNRR